VIEMTMRSDDAVEGTDGSRARVALSTGVLASGSGVVALLIFILQNTDDVEVTFLFWSFTWPVWLLIVVSATLGALIWLGLGVLRRHQRRKNRRAARRS
jgi:uncharacterized integral membrane protein